MQNAAPATAEPMTSSPSVWDRLAEGAMAQRGTIGRIPAKGER